MIFYLALLLTVDLVFIFYLVISFFIINVIVIVRLTVCEVGGLLISLSRRGRVLRIIIIIIVVIFGGCTGFFSLVSALFSWFRLTAFLCVILACFFITLMIPASLSVIRSMKLMIVSWTNTRRFCLSMSTISMPECYPTLSIGHLMLFLELNSLAMLVRLHQNPWYTWCTFLSGRS